MVEIELLPSSSSSSSSTYHWKYDVFLSFSGKDTRKRFTDFLYGALDRCGINTFRDDKKLEKGDEFEPELLKVIGESWCSIIVFSKSYASSSWCLKEIAEIVKQKNERGHKVYPIFYKMEPFEFRRQKGIVQDAFAKHQKRCDEEEVQKWRAALTEVAGLQGWVFSKDRYSESELVEDIVNTISAKLSQIYPSPRNDLIGVDSRLEELHSKLNIGGDDVRIVGICGMGGIGKTTLARLVYNQMSPQDFEGKSFLSDVREKSKEQSEIVSLQQLLLSNILSEKQQDVKISEVHEGKALISRRLRRKKVLIVIDDVDDAKTLKHLVDRDWVGSGSRIIITTRDKHLLLSYGADDWYEPTLLDRNEALHLFSLKAFKSHMPKEGLFEDYSIRVVQYTGGLPLALEVLGCFFCGRDEAEWESAIERLDSDPDETEIFDKLEISYDGLKETEKKIFLDIACFFKGETKDFVTQIMDGCKYYPEIGIKVLIQKSLVKVVGCNRLWMHNLIQEMGRKIVAKKCIEEPGKRSRLWDERDVYHVLTENTATEDIEGMVINIKGEQNKEFNFGADAFSNMKRLRLLKVFNLPNCPDIRYLSNKSVLLEWHRFPSRSLPSDFQPNNLVALFLPDSRIQQLWKGNRCFNKLKFVNLKGCENLIEAPDFTTTPNLESLVLAGCTKIKELPSSIGHLSKLVLLNMKDCRNLASLPSSIGRCRCLKFLNLSGCSRVEILPENLQQVDLEELDLSGTGIREPQPFIFQFKNLKYLSFKGCKGPPSISQSYWPPLFQPKRGRGSADCMALTLPSVSSLSSLTELNLSDCNLGEGALPSNFCILPSLKNLILSGNHFISLPGTLTQLPKLTLLRLSNCKWLKSLPGPLTSIQLVDIDGCDSLEVLPDPRLSSSTEGTSINCSNCYALAEKNNAVTLMKKHLKILANEKKTIDLFIPGSEIPEWFSHRTYECSIDEINLPLPPNIRKDSKWMGIALCCVLASPWGEDAWGDVDILTVAVNPAAGRNYPQFIPGFYLESQYHGRCPVINDHLWLQYWNRDMFSPTSSFSEERRSNETEEDLAENNELFELLFMFRPYLKGSQRPTVKKCGFRIVYEKDLEEMEQMINGTNFDDIHVHHQDTDGGDHGESIRSMSEAEAAPSESHIAKDQRSSQPNWLQNIFSFMITYCCFGWRD